MNGSKWGWKRTAATALLIAVSVSSAIGQEASLEEVPLSGANVNAELAAEIAKSEGENQPEKTVEISAAATASAAEDKKKKGKGEAAKLREEAKKKAQERAKLSKEGKPPPKQEEKQAKPKLTREERRLAELERKRIERERNLKKAKEEALEREEKAKGKGRRLQAAQIPPTCSDGEKNGLETDVDCGGEKCRNEMYHFHGLKIGRRCSYAQKCAANFDCISSLCTKGACAGRKPFIISSDEEMLRNMHFAFFELGESANGGPATHLPIGKVETFYTRVVNPDAQALSLAEESFVKAEVAAFAKEQGLSAQGAPKVLQYGFLTRGHSVDFVRQLCQKASQTKFHMEL